jgi:hypothetical protein
MMADDYIAKVRRVLDAQGSETFRVEQTAAGTEPSLLRAVDLAERRRGANRG